MFKKSFLLALILSSCHLAPTLAQQRVEKIDVLEGQKTYKNYVKNPSAIKNTNGASVSSATIARDTDTADKLDGIASFNCDASALNGYCLWQVSTINEGDKTGNCEVSVTFKGDASLYSLRLTDGTNTLYDLPLKNQTDWGGASFNYPCGATRDVRLVQTSAGTAPAVNIGRIYYGPATNLVNATADIYLGQIATTGSWTTNTTYTGHYWRVGDRLRAQVKVATTGAPTAASLTVNLPSGLSIDTSKGSYSYVDSPLGSASYYFTGSTSTKYFNGEALYNSATSVALIVGDHEASGGSNVPSLHRTTFTSSTFPFTFANGDYIIFNYEVPIVGWASSSMAVIPSIPSSPTIQRFTSGSGTYTTPQGVKYIKVKMVGGGGGGGGGGNGTGLSSTGNAGGNTSFGDWVAGGGSGGGGAGTTVGVVPGGSPTSNTVGTGTLILNSIGGYGLTGSWNMNVSAVGAVGTGGSSCVSGPVSTGYNSNSATAGISATGNTGNGGSGGGRSEAGYGTGSGGAGGSCLEFTMSSTQVGASKSFTVGIGGAGGAASSGTGSGGAGGSGVIIVEEYYHTENAPILVGSVTSGTSGAERIERGTLDMVSNVMYKQSGNWVASITNNGTGDKTLNFSTPFPETPSCICTINEPITTSTNKCHTYSIGNGTVRVVAGYYNGSGSSITLGNYIHLNIICMGPK